MYKINIIHEKAVDVIDDRIICY